jgi:hypothetical protein
LPTSPAAIGAETVAELTVPIGFGGCAAALPVAAHSDDPA